nr:integrase, catalytic region, zinc finger, CCHC-type, peptidase aspartic, catalytic [Tanacetum cinerariifolium]
YEHVVMTYGSTGNRMIDLLDDNNFFIFDDVNVRNSPVSKMPFRKKPHDSMHVRSKSNMIKSLPRTVHKWLPKLQPLAEPVAKCNDFAVIASYGDVVIGSMTIKKVYYVKHVVIDTHIADQEVLLDKMSVKLVELDKHVRDLKNTVLEKDFKFSELEECVCNKDLEIEKCLERLNIKIDLEEQDVSLLEKEKENLKIIESLKSKGFESSEKAISESENQSENNCHVIEKECDKVENSKVIAPGMFNNDFAVIAGYGDVVIGSTMIKKVYNTVHMIMPSKDTLYNGRKGIGFENPSYFEKAKDLRPRLYNEKVIGLGYTSMFLIHSNEALEIRKFKRSRENKIEFVYDYGNLNASYVNEKINFSDDYFQKIINPDFEKIDSPFQQTSSLKPMNDLLDDNNFFIFNDVNVRISPVSKMPFRKKHHDSLNIVQIFLWIIDSGCSKHMTGNHALLTNFVEKFLGTVRFGSNDFAVIASYGDVVIGSMTIKKVYYVKHVVIDTHVEFHEKCAKLKEERYEYMIRYSPLFDNDKQHRKQIADQEAHITHKRFETNTLR